MSVIDVVIRYEGVIIIKHNMKPESVDECQKIKKNGLISANLASTSSPQDQIFINNNITF
jgi:hypothetical protein